MQIKFLEKSRLSLRSLLFLFILIIPFKLFSQTEYETSLIKKAEELSLYEDDYWLLLCHYKKSITGYKSLLDDKNFFLAPDGKKNPKAELEATIHSFFNEKTEDVIHPTYKYSSRYKWLCNKLNIDKNQLPYDGDTEYAKIKEMLKVKSFYLVFPAAYMNSPVSMFGHLFFLIESENTPHLAGMSINYGAIATDPPSLIYAIKGIFGAYPGRYEILPYYKQITKYSYLDMRDTWEYKLNLSDDQNDTMLRHILEMSFTYTDYFFLDENCAYCILFPIEAARPDTKLTEERSLVVEPVQVIRKLKKHGLLGNAEYRPSMYSKMMHKKGFMNYSQKKFVKKLCLGKAEISNIPEGLSDEEKANLLEFASDYLIFLLSDKKISQKEYQKRFIEVLTARNKIKCEKSLAFEIPVPTSQPQNPHGSHMVSTGTGVDDGDFFTDAGFRLLAHNMMDRDDGYSPNSQIEFCTANLRYNVFEKKFSLRYADIVNIVSMPVYDSFIPKKGFLLRAGVAQNLCSDGNENLAFHLKGAAGISCFILKCTQAYFFIGADNFFSGKYNYNSDILAGGEIGFITTAGIWKQKISGSIYQSPFDIEHTRFEARAEERLSLHQHLSLNAFYSFSGDFRSTKHSAGCSLRLFY